MASSSQFGQKIVPHLWFNRKAEEAVNFYTAIFNKGEIQSTSYYTKAGHDVHGMDAGEVLTIEFEIEEYKLIALNGGPHFELNPSISFFVTCPTKEDVDELWEALLEGGTPIMPLESYEFSEYYGWIQDKYGVTWQLMFAEQVDERTIVPSLMYVGDNAGKAEEAINFYTSVFSQNPVSQDKSEVNAIFRYGPNMEPDKEGTIAYADFYLEGQLFAAMDSAQEHHFNFNEAISLLVNCKTQEEIDYFWEKLSVDPEAEQCGWLKDKYGVSWQIVPTVLSNLLEDTDREKADKVMEALLQMKKLNIEKLKQAAV